MDKNWLKKRWAEFRWGHSVYLSFLLSMVNFVLIVYRLLIEYVPFLKGWFASLQLFFVVFVVAYLPTAIVVGRWHRIRQIPVDARLRGERDPFTMEMVEILRDLKPLLPQLETLLKKGGEPTHE